MNVEATITQRFALTVMVLSIAVLLAGCAIAPKAGKTGKLNTASMKCNRLPD